MIFTSFIPIHTYLILGQNRTRNYMYVPFTTVVVKP